MLAPRRGVPGPIGCLLLLLGCGPEDGGAADQAILEIRAAEPRDLVLPDLSVSTGAGCDGGLCLRWSQGPGSYLVVRVPPVEGVHSPFSMEYSFPGGPPPSPAQTLCAPACGSATVAVDDKERALRVDVSALVSVEFNQCRTPYCVQFVPQGDGTLATLYERCAGACPTDGRCIETCPRALPCQGSLVPSGGQTCPNPDVVTAPLSITARAVLTSEAVLAAGP